jgi:hypothetical protein
VRKNARVCWTSSPLGSGSTPRLLQLTSERLWGSQTHSGPRSLAGIVCAIKGCARIEPAVSVSDSRAVIKLTDPAGHGCARARIHYPYGRAAKWIKRDERGFYYSNADSPPARFYFKTSREAVADLAIEIGVTDEERAGVP